MNRTMTVGILIFTTVLVPRAAGQDDPKRRAEEEQRRVEEQQRRAAEVERRAVEALVNQRPEVLRLLERLHEIKRRLDENNRVAVNPKTANQSLVKEKAELEDELEKTRKELYAQEAARREVAQSSMRPKRDEITKAVHDLAVLRAKSAELEMTIRQLRDELAQEERRLQARTEKRFREDPGRGMEEKLDTILKKLESVEKRLTDLERKRQPDNKKP
jgi:hypothetical protein